MDVAARTTTTQEPEVRRARADGARRATAHARRRWLRRAAWAIALLAIGALVAYAAAPKPVPVDVAAVRRGAMEVAVDEAGRARVRDRYAVSAPFEGELARIELHAGDAVEQGRTIATIVPAEPPLLDARTRSAAEARVGSARAAERQAETSTRRAEIALDESRRELETTRALAAGGTMSKDALAHAEAETRLREQELASARFSQQVAASETAAALSTLGLFDARRRRGEAFEVKAPVSGRILRVLHPDAGVVGPGTPLLEIGDPTALEIAVDVLTADAVRIAPNAPTRLHAWGGAPLAAHVRRVEPSAFTRISALGVEEQRVTVIVDLDAPRAEWESLGDGWRVETRVVVWSTPDALVAPAGAVFRHGDGWAAYVVENGRAALRAVEVGERGGAEVQLVRGLGAGERVIVHPGESVAEGTRVAPR